MSLQCRIEFFKQILAIQHLMSVYIKGSGSLCGFCKLHIVLTKIDIICDAKILTAYIILKNCDLNATVTVSHDAANPGHSSSVCGLKEGDVITVQDRVFQTDSGYTAPDECLY